MHFSTIAAVFLAAGAFASPVAKRDLEVYTDVAVVYTTVYVTPGQQLPTQVPKPVEHYHAAPAPAPAPAPIYAPAPAPAPVPAPAPAPVPAPAPAPAPASDYGPNEYSKNAILAHNQARMAHNAGNLQWSETLANSSAAVAQSCQLIHNMSFGTYGQNLMSGYSADTIHDIVYNGWYTEEAPYFKGLYGNPSPSMDLFEKWGHYTQVLWKETTHVGCYTQDCGSAQPITCCNYYPPGNVIGNFAANVQ